MLQFNMYIFLPYDILTFTIIIGIVRIVMGIFSRKNGRIPHNLIKHNYYYKGMRQHFTNVLGMVAIIFSPCKNDLPYS